MGTSAPCPYCGAAPDAPGDRHPDPMRQAVDALYREVAHIRMLAEGSPDQSAEIRLLQETVARLRGRSFAAVQYAQPGNGQRASHGPSHHPAAASANGIAHGSRSTSAA